MLCCWGVKLEPAEGSQAKKEHDVFDVDVGEAGDCGGGELWLFVFGSDHFVAEIEGGQGRQHHENRE